MAEDLAGASVTAGVVVLPNQATVLLDRRRKRDPHVVGVKTDEIPLVTGIGVGCFRQHIALGRGQDRFNDPTRDRMIRFNVHLGGRVSTATAIKQKKAALQGTPGLRVLGTSTVTMQTTMGRSTGSTIVYTCRRGNTTRWVATRYIGPAGEALIEITVAGRLKDRKVLGTVINRATQSITLPRLTTIGESARRTNPDPPGLVATAARAASKADCSLTRSSGAASARRSLHRMVIPAPVSRA